MLDPMLINRAYNTKSEDRNFSRVVNSSYIYFMNHATRTALLIPNLYPVFAFQHDLLPEGSVSGQNSHGYTIRRVDRFDAGRYTCTADNGVGSPATAQIALQVLCKSTL